MLYVYLGRKASREIEKNFFFNEDYVKGKTFSFPLYDDFIIWENIFFSFKWRLYKIQNKKTIFFSFKWRLYKILSEKIIIFSFKWRLYKILNKKTIILSLKWRSYKIIKEKTFIFYFQRKLYKMKNDSKWATIFLFL